MESQTVNSEVSYVIEENISRGSINVINLPTSYELKKVKVPSGAKRLPS